MALLFVSIILIIILFTYFVVVVCFMYNQENQITQFNSLILFFAYTGLDPIREMFYFGRQKV